MSVWLRDQGPVYRSANLTGPVAHVTHPALLHTLLTNLLQVGLTISWYFVWIVEVQWEKVDQYRYIRVMDEVVWAEKSVQTFLTNIELRGIAKGVNVGKIKLLLNGTYNSVHLGNEESFLPVIFVFWNQKGKNAPHEKQTKQKKQKKNNAQVKRQPCVRSNSTLYLIVHANTTMSHSQPKNQTETSLLSVVRVINWAIQPLSHPGSSLFHLLYLFSALIPDDQTTVIHGLLGEVSVEKCLPMVCGCLVDSRGHWKDLERKKVCETVMRNVSVIRWLFLSLRWA